MTRATIMGLAALAVLSSPADAQRRSESNAFISVFAGLTEASDLWSIGNQRVGLLSIGGGGEVAVDTFRIARQSRPGFTGGIQLTIFSSSKLGFVGELSYSGLGYRDDCAVEYLDESIPRMPTNDLNQTFCEDLDNNNGISGAVTLLGGITYRPFPQWPAYPYIRAVVGVADQGGTTTEFSDTYAGVNRPIILDPQNASVRPTAGAALGLTIPTAPGYQFRLEVRDQLFLRDIVTGAANALAIAEVSKEWRHTLALTVAVDIVLERKRGRRY